MKANLMALLARLRVFRRVAVAESGVADLQRLAAEIVKAIGAMHPCKGCGVVMSITHRAAKLVKVAEDEFEIRCGWCHAKYENTALYRRRMKEAIAAEKAGREPDPEAMRERQEATAH